MATAIELFGNPPASPATVSSGGTDTPAAGTAETLTMAGGYASYPQVSNAATPPTQLHIYDTAAPAEIMLVTNMAGSTWTVTRGAEGTVAAHAAGYTIAQVVSAQVLGLLLQNGNSRSTLPASQGDATTRTATTTAFTALTKAWPIPAGDANAATIYRLTAFGSGVWATASCSFNFIISVFGVQVAEIRLGSAMYTTTGGQQFCWRLTADVIVTSAATAGAIEAAMSGATSVFGANLSATGGSSANSTAGISGQNASTAANTAAASTMQLQGQWVTSTGTVTCFGSVFERLGALRAARRGSGGRDQREGLGP